MKTKTQKTFRFLNFFLEFKIKVALYRLKPHSNVTQEASLK